MAFTGLGRTLPGGGDIYLIDWILNQNIQKIPYHLTEIFQGNIFFPFKDTMAFADLLLPSSLIAYFPVKISGLPATAYNFNLIFGQFSLLLIGFLWFYELSKDRLVSFVGIVALSFSQIRFNFVGYLQMWSSAWWIMSCWFIWKFSKYSKPKYLIFASVFAVIQIWESPFPVFYIYFSTLVIILVFKGIDFIKNIKDYLLPLMIFLFGSIPIVFKYYKVSREYATVRSIRETAHFSMSLNDIWGILFSPGLLSLLFIALLVIFLLKIKKNNDFIWISSLGIFSFLMSLGPVLKLNDATFKIFGKYFIPLPYGIFYYLIPGFKGLRTPLRWIWLFAFCVTAFFVVVFSKYKFKFKNLILLFCLCIAIIGGTRKTNAMTVPGPEEIPNVYKELKILPKSVVIEMPMYTWGAGKPFLNEFEREYYGIYHKKKLVNGTSGLNPPEWEKLQVFLWKEFPSDSSTQKLTELGVNYIVVHKNEYNEEKLNHILEWEKDKLIWWDDSSLIYELN